MLNLSENFCTYIYAFSKSLTFLHFENMFFFCFGCSAVSHIYNSFSHTSFTGSVNLKQNITPNMEGKDKLETGNSICKFAFLSTWRLPNGPAIKTTTYFNYSIKYIVWLAAKGFQYVFLIWLVYLLLLYDFNLVFGTWHFKNPQQGAGDETYTKNMLHLKKEFWYLHTTFGSIINNQIQRSALQGIQWTDIRYSTLYT
jgi:hypothetical protein